MARFNLVLSDTQNALIDDLKTLCDLQTTKDVIENALMLLGWAAAEATKGRSIASVDEERKVYQEVQTPALLGAKLKTELAKKATEKLAPSAAPKESESAPAKSKTRALARQLG
ncbi:hypothetical protein [Methylosinus sp. Sm6]|uniref:hypothetical protein n=1 Tax=Methylosinus sp. Sm6 TaxID=2866948 RepID=UPI001C99EDF1|nr:hypothetical protein [Methylosinus sp. Sm6]MBY6243506.1 hypothetical protein [Methylosinus sp. Sm6]